jgi:endoglycosylceramidase
MVDRADRDMVGWQEWHYCGCDDPTTTGPGDTQAIVIDPAKPPTGDNLKTAKLAILSRPYPRAVAGTPQSYGFDAASGTFNLAYTTARADGQSTFTAGAETLAVLPARQYPQGYAVTVHGAMIASAPGEMVLRLLACDGATQVTVSVARGAGANQQSCS